ncbi:MAG TPA: N-formylglutamate amidohydrolase [Casimicrobiaceae bacterium]|nr:N-formylglutamate amidohydrolase [Casimicrobiaceae bacterium]
MTCEHGGNRIPRPYASLFHGHRRVLDSHRGYDAGALTMARTLARALRATLIVSTVSRLLVELNRSPGHRNLFSPISRAAPDPVRRNVYRRYYLPYRAKVQAAVRASLRSGARVIHVASHSFTPVLNGRMRLADVGLLYDPRRAGERKLCLRWQSALHSIAPGWRVRRNYPYRGNDDGLTRHLRRVFPANRYSGIELEINQRIVHNDERAWRDARSKVVEALRIAVQAA